MIIKDNTRIVDLEDWRIRGAPKSPEHWAEGRSAMETARYWLAAVHPALPPEISALLASHPEFGPVEEWRAEPEVRLKFDSFRGETRNSDLVIQSRDARGEFFMAIEAKADENFSGTVSQVLAAALEEKLKKPRSNGIVRVEQLATSLFKPPPKGSRLPKIAVLRYQLLTATAGALAEARRRGVGRVVLLVQEFVTTKTTDKKHQANGKDLDAFIRRLSAGAVREVAPGQLYGPIPLHSSPEMKGAPSLFIGKAVCNIRPLSAK